ncbi:MULTISPECIES: substrate-binding domain-containing protein [unclassified Rhizobium]|uniref:substrate-binding domain-containing protein n=1 Tax=unclassified Rhizobium TaxID=2613769 RepID=UPI0028AA3D0D|nr:MULTISPECIES: substrate-binding domain-containing protein [unclassified Rhizobium]
MAAAKVAAQREITYRQRVEQEGLGAEIVHFLRAKDRPRAVFVWSDLDAVPLLNAAHMSGIRVPEDWVSDDVIHDNASMQVFSEGDTRRRLVWIHDTLPDPLATWLASAMDQMAPVFQQALKSPKS